MTHKRLWVIEWRPGNQSVIPSPELCPDLKGWDVLAADQFYAVIHASLSDLETLVRDYPYWRITGHPADGRWISEGGDEVYIADAIVLDTPEDLWDALGFDPVNFGAESWDDVDGDVVWNHVPTF